MYNNMNQLCVYMYPLHVEPPSHPSPHCIPLGYHRACPVPYGRLPRASRFTCGVCICQGYSPSSSHSPLRPCVHVYSFPTNRFTRTIFLDPTHATTSLSIHLSMERILDLQCRLLFQWNHHCLLRRTLGWAVSGEGCLHFWRGPEAPIRQEPDSRQRRWKTRAFKSGDVRKALRLTQCWT